MFSSIFHRDFLSYSMLFSQKYLTFNVSACMLFAQYNCQRLITISVVVFFLFNDFTNDMFGSNFFSYLPFIVCISMSLVLIYVYMLFSVAACVSVQCQCVYVSYVSPYFSFPGIAFFLFLLPWLVGLHSVFVSACCQCLSGVCNLTITWCSRVKCFFMNKQNRNNNDFSQIENNNNFLSLSLSLLSLLFLNCKQA